MLKIFMLSLCIFALGACSKSDPSTASSSSATSAAVQTSVSSESPTEKSTTDQPTLNNRLANAGWAVQTGEPALSTYWGTIKPVAVTIASKDIQIADSSTLTAEEASEDIDSEELEAEASQETSQQVTMEFSAGWFADDEAAKTAFDYLAPADAEVLESQDSKDQVKRVWVTMPDEEGYWMVELHGVQVLSAWTSSTATKDELNSLFDAIFH